MEEFASSIKTAARYTFFLFAAIVLLWLFMPQRVFFQGLILGTIASIINGFILYLKTLQAGEAAVTPGKKVRGIGMLQRLLVAGFAVYMAARLPHLFSFAGVLIGLFAVQAVTLILAISQHFSIKK
ncbi:ATP synthase subunit I [Aneurinibacillus tyrosinisolvens]|uniref:ATP synthase subunit I n=1 Tax=Aneurinibacillus tyrosinisolvens TaxID=1443435 RepID=UPI00063FAA8C|nr:ATP synthase subunit I [Aneurinibacillus tyrosinisolvens]